MAAGSPQTRPLSIAIIGGGIAGLSLAIALHSRSIHVNVYERAEAFTEIGAGIGFGENAVRAMEVCDPRMKEAFERVVTGGVEGQRGGPRKWFDWVDASGGGDDGAEERWLFNMYQSPKGGTCHRAHFLEEILKLLPQDTAHFRKHLQDVIDCGEDGVRLQFSDGTSAVADAVIGCDGIRSRVRQLIAGEENPEAYAHYTHKYAYRGLVPMDKAIAAVGEKCAMSKHMHTGPNAHLLTFPVAHGRLLNVVAFVTDPEPWSRGLEQLVVPVSHTQAQRDFADWHQNVRSIIDLLAYDENLDSWAIYDTAEHPMSTYYKGPLLVIGDAGHASSPHHGAAGGMCVEDSAVVADLLENVTHVMTSSNIATTRQSMLEAAFAAFDTVRKERTRFLVSSSRLVGELFDWRDPKCGNNPEKMKAELDWRCRKIWHAQISETLVEAREDFTKRLGIHGNT